MSEGTLEQRARKIGQLAMRVADGCFIFTEATPRPGKTAVVQLTDMLNQQEAEMYLDRAEQERDNS